MKGNQTPLTCIHTVECNGVIARGICWCAMVEYHAQCTSAAAALGVIDWALFSPTLAGVFSTHAGREALPDRQHFSRRRTDRLLNCVQLVLGPIHLVVTSSTSMSQGAVPALSLPNRRPLPPNAVASIRSVVLYSACDLALLQRAHLKRSVRSRAGIEVNLSIDRSSQRWHFLRELLAMKISYPACRSPSWHTSSPAS